MTVHSTKRIFSVTELTRKIKSLLEEKFSMVWISGEISNYRTPSSGHSYFSLKDDKAQISAVMFRGQLRNLRFSLEDGISIVGLGRVSLYEPRGTYQIILEYAEPQGVGALQVAFEQLKQRLDQEGLFAAHHKKALPFLPDAICVITSPTGAVIRDILNVAQRRFPGMPVRIMPVRVQGDSASAEIVRAIETANRHAVADLIIIARGGGSLEDLQPFNSEAVARAIFASELPVVSAVGHETDFTIADFVSDLRAPTPSAAAELTVPVKAELQYRIAQLRNGCFDAVGAMIRQYRVELSHLTRLVIHPIKKIQEFQIRTDELTDRLFHSVNQYALNKRHLFAKLNSDLLRCNPIRFVEKHKSIVDINRYKILDNIKKLISESRQRLTSQHATLVALSPQQVLQRGYSITRTLPPDSTVVTDAGSVASGDRLEILLAKGKLTVDVDLSKGE